jgi:hypothetical protein
MKRKDKERQEKARRGKEKDGKREIRLSKEETTVVEARGFIGERKVKEGRKDGKTEGGNYVLKKGIVLEVGRLRKEGREGKGREGMKEAPVTSSTGNDC